MLQQSFNPDKLWRKILIIMIFISLAFILTFCTKKTTSIDEQLLAPSNLQISLIENNKIQISWTDNSTNETKFLIARKVGTFNWQDIFDEVEANITSFSNIIPTNSDTIYSYKVRAFDGSDYSEYSDIVAWFSVNSAPTNLQLEQIDQDSIKLTWQDNSVGELNFRIDRKIGDADWQENYKILEQDTISYIDYNPSLYDTCYYKVFAVCGNSYSGSTQNYFIPFLQAPSNLQIEPISVTSVKLTWQDKCENEDGYLIYKMEEGGDWDSTNIPANTEEWIDENIIPGIVNYYKVCAYIGDDHSGYIEDSLNTLPAPTNLQIEQLNVHTFKLDWQDNSNFEQGFKIDRKIDDEEWENEIGNVDPNITTWTDYTIGRNYEVVYYKVYAYYGEYNSTKIESNSNIVFPAPSNLIYQKLTISSIKLNWADNSNGENGFKIDKKVGENDWQLDYAIVGENIKEWIDENAEINETIQYRIYAYCGNNISNSIETGEIDNSIPAPSNIIITQDNVHTFSLIWNDNSNGEEGFKIDRKIDNEDWINEIGIVDSNITNWTDSTIGRNYYVVYYRVYGYYEDCNSTKIESNSNIVFPAPSNLTYQKLTISSIKLNWTDNSNGEDGFKIDKKVGENEWQLDYAIVGENIEEWTDENAEINEIIQYRIYAYCGNNVSDSIETEQIDNTIPAPSNLIITQDNVHTFSLIWNDNSNGEQGYKIDRKIDDEEWLNEIGIVNSNIITWTDSTVGRNYSFVYYRVYAYYEDNNSIKIESNSNIVFPAPSNLQYEILSVNSIKLNWNDNSISEEGFKIDKKVGDENWIIEFATLDENITEWLDENIEISKKNYYSIYSFYGDNISSKVDIEISNTFTKTFGGSYYDYGKSVSQTDDGGFIMTGSTESYGAGGYDIWLIKTDALGNEEWNRTFGGSDNDRGCSVSQTIEGGYIIIGDTRSYGAGNYDIWLIKTDAIGNEEWNRTFGGISYEHGYSLSQTSDGGFIITGNTFSYGAGEEDIWLIKTDAIGNEEWNRTFGGSNYDRGNSLYGTNDGGFIITGNTFSYGAGEADIWLINTDALGNEEWNRTFGGVDSERGYSVSQTNEGGFIIAGYTLSFGAGDWDIWLIKTDALGNEEWNRTFGGSSDDHGYSVLQTTDCCFIITGDTRSYGAGEKDVWIIKTDVNGNEEWNRTFGGSDNDVGYSLSPTEDGGFIITGYTESYGAGNYDVWLIKTDAQGNVE